jgi:hypothetical protein
MILARVWRRQLLGGVSAALIVPGALVGALSVLALAGGFARLGALGQAFAGPPAPVAAGTAGPGANGGRSAPGAVLTALAAATAGSRAIATAAPGSGGRGRHSGQRPGSAATGRRPSRSSAPAPTRAPAPAGAPATPGASPHPTLIDEVVSAGASVTGQLPGPAGPVATQALQSAGSTLDGVAPAPPSPAPGQVQSQPIISAVAPSRLP